MIVGLTRSHGQLDCATNSDSALFSFAVLLSESKSEFRKQGVEGHSRRTFVLRRAVVAEGGVPLLLVVENLDVVEELFLILTPVIA